MHSWKIFERNRIYFVTCEELSEGRSDEEMVEAVLAGGVRVIQLRDKHASHVELLKKAFRLRKITQNYEAVLMINDDPELALEVEADGVHLGQNDFPMGEVRQVHYQGRSGKDLIIGLSTHNPEEVRAAMVSTIPDYINLGPVFPTQTKKNCAPIVGRNEQGEYDFTVLGKMIEATQIPFTVMGGIKGEHIAPLASLGVRHFALVTALSQHPFPKKQAASLIAAAERSGRFSPQEEGVTSERLMSINATTSKTNQST